MKKVSGPYFDKEVIISMDLKYPRYKIIARTYAQAYKNIHFLKGNYYQTLSLMSATKQSLKETIKELF